MNEEMKAELKKRLDKTASQPLLALSYKAAVMSICGVPTRIAEKNYPRLRAVQKKLDDLNVAYDTYAWTIVKVYWDFCKGKDMRSVPLNIFCGTKAWERFLKILESTVEISTEHDEQWSRMVHAELNAARMYIGAQVSRKMVTLSQMRRGAGQSSPRPEVVAEVERLLGETYGISGTYDEIIVALYKRRHPSKA